MKREKQNEIWKICKSAKIFFSLQNLRKDEIISVDDNDLFTRFVTSRFFWQIKREKQNEIWEICKSAKLFF
jgi:hypothetical protein